MDGNLQFYTGCSLVDITNTKIRYGDSDARLQQRNWETVTQALSLRTQPLNLTTPVCKDVNISHYINLFGEMYEGVHKVWFFSWGVDRDDIYKIDDEPYNGLLQDFEQVPILNGLNETARFMLPIFYPYGAIKNIHFFMGTLNLDTV